MKLSYINQLDNLTLTPSSETPGYPVSNLQHVHLVKVWRGTGSATENIKVDTGGVLPECAYLAGCNFSDSAVVTLQGNDTDVWTSPSVEIIMDHHNDVYYTYSSDFADLRYWRFLIVDSSNPDGYIEIGRAWIGDFISVSWLYTEFSETRNNTSQEITSISGQPYGDVGYIYKSYNMVYPYLSNTEKSDLQDFGDYVHKSRPFFVQFETTDDMQIGNLYCIMTNDLVFGHIYSLTKWNTTIAFMEAK